jgi:hypothetical protein
MQRLVIGVVGHQHLGQQPGGGDPLVDHVRCHRRLHQAFALLALPLAEHMPFHAEHTRLAFQLVGNVFSDAHHLAAASTHGAVGLVPHLAPRRLSRQWPALRSLFVRYGWRRVQQRQLGLHRLDVGAGGDFDQAALLGTEVLSGYRSHSP